MTMLHELELVSRVLNGMELFPDDNDLQLYCGHLFSKLIWTEDEEIFELMKYLFRSPYLDQLITCLERNHPEFHMTNYVIGLSQRLHKNGSLTQIPPNKSPTNS
eukprot:TRINITY_DN1486_c0_g1_i2.p1 TRINITY_DN1486_c0_g1~~TRINITY_DN1486_c0_g1_i2.p1  ORF type:complete len:104 (-),score=16.82 TRINITY_DN1486_c0_g1_i2:30-341(-)